MSKWYRTIDDIFKSMLLRVTDRGRYLKSRVGGCLEVTGTSHKLLTPEACVLRNSRRNISIPYACAELLWYLSGSNDTVMMQAYAPQYKNFADEDGLAHGAYGHRWIHNPGFNSKFGHTSQLLTVIELLKKDPNTRQAVITMWDSKDLAVSFEGGCKDIPCTLTHQFLLRDNELHMVTSMRSNDLWLGTPYDIFCNCMLQIIIAAELGCGVGHYTHNVGSLHIYEKHIEAASEAISASESTYWGINSKAYSTIETGSFILEEQIKFHTGLEEDIRSGVLSESIRSLMNLNSIKNTVLRDLVLGAASKWTNIDPEQLSHPILKERLIHGKS